jgi:DNA-binding Xre family transcriptional regulator
MQMALPPAFTEDGLLPPADYEQRARVSFGIPAIPARWQGPRHHQDSESTMIRNETEYQEAVRRLGEEAKRLADHKARLQAMKLAPDEVKRALDPLRSFHMQLAEEVESYERLQRGDVGELTNLHGLGRMLVALRIALGFTQRELAERLGVHESQVSRDERNEYHGITVERVSRVLDALGVQLTSRFDEPVLS